MTPNSCSDFEKEEQTRKDHNICYQTVLQGHCNQKPGSGIKIGTCQWNKTESPEINPSLYGQLMFEKRGRSIKWNKNSLFTKWCWKSWTATCKKVKLDHQLTPYKKINSRWIKDLNISHDTIKVLEENIGRKISDIPHSSIFTNMSPISRDIKEIINKWDFIKIKSFCSAKENSIKVKKEPTVWENIFPMIARTRI